MKFIVDPPENASGSGEATIGTSLPSGYTALSINNDLSAVFAGTVETTTLRTDVLNNKANSANIIYRSGTDTLVGGGISAKKMYVADDGNVGIGVNPGAIVAGNVRLDVGTVGCGLTSRQNFETILTANADYGHYTTTDKPASRIYLGNDGKMYFSVDNGATRTAGQAITFVHALQLANNKDATFGGDVDVPTKLVVGEHATAEVRIKKTNTGDGKLSWYNNDGSSSTQTAYINHDAAENLYYYLPANKSHIFYGSGSERLSIGGDVNVNGSTDLNITGASRRLSFTSGSGTVKTTTGNSLILQTNSTDGIIIDGSTQNVGVGGAPTNTFSIKDGTNANFEMGCNSDSVFLQSYNRTSSAWADIAFLTNGETMRLKNNGRLGIGTNSPATLLSNTATRIANADGLSNHLSGLNWAVNGQGYTAALSNLSTTGSQHNGGLLVEIASTDATDKILDLESGGVNRLRVLGTGAATFAGTIASGAITSTGDVVAFSDKKLKKNIKTLDGSKVYDMRGVSFTRKDTEKEGSGVIAQEIQKIAPELISETDGTLGVAYGNLTGYLIEAIKDLKAEIEELKQCNKCEDCNCKKK